MKYNQCCKTIKEKRRLINRLFLKHYFNPRQRRLREANHDDSIDHLGAAVALSLDSHRGG